MYPPHHEGGYELIWRGAVTELRSRGHDVSVLTTDHRRDGVPDDPEPGVSRTLRWYWRDHAYPSMSWRGRLALERHNARVLDAELATLRPDVVSWWAMGGLSLGLLERVRRAGLPAVAVVIDDWLVYGPRVDGWVRLGSRLGPVRTMLERATRLPARPPRADAARWLFCSQFTRDAAEAARGPLPGSVVHPGVDPSLGGTRDSGPWRWRLLYYGRIDARKGIATAIEALTSLPAQAVLTVLGGGDRAHAAELQDLADRRGVGDRVAFRPQVERDALPDAIADADVVVFPVSWEEPWGLVPLEAMTVGRPVVATGRGGSSEYLCDGENCLLYDGLDAGALASCLRQLASDPELRSKLRRGGIATASQHSERAFHDRVESALLIAGARR